MSLLALCSICLSCAERSPVPGSTFLLDGRVTLSGSGAQGAEAILMRTDAPTGTFTQPAAVKKTGKDGAFRMYAPAGTYVLLARRGEHFSFFGRNPIHLHAPLRGLTLPLLEAHPAHFSTTSTGREAVEGKVLRAGTPVPGARVTAYLDMATGLRGPGYQISQPTSSDGSYTLSLSPGTYVLAARTRLSGTDTGPLNPGDLFGVASEFPLRLGEGKTVHLDIEVLELPSREKMARTQTTTSLLVGIAVDAAGHAVSGMRVCLYDDSRMLNQPLYVSDATDTNGGFSIKTSLAGTLYLGARERLGGPPASGERIGFYTGAPDGRVELTPGNQLRDLKILVQVVR